PKTKSVPSSKRIRRSFRVLGSGTGSTRCSGPLYGSDKEELPSPVRCDYPHRGYTDPVLHPIILTTDQIPDRSCRPLISGMFRSFTGGRALSHHRLPDADGVSFAVLDDRREPYGFYLHLRNSDLAPQLLHLREYLVDVINHDVVDDRLGHLPLVQASHVQGAA